MNINNKFFNKLSLNIFVFIIALFMHYRVFEVVGYMYTINYHHENINSLISIVGLLILTYISLEDNEILEIFSSILILGIYMPVAVVISKIDFNLIYLFFTFLSVATITITMKFFSKFLSKLMVRNYNYFKLTFSSLHNATFSIFLLIIVYLFFKRNGNFNFDLISTYYNAYAMRADVGDSDLFNYFYGWCLLVAFPMFYSCSGTKFRYLFIFFILLSSILIFQLEATKITLLSSILILFFSILYRFNKHIRFSNSPQYFFVVLFLFCYFSGSIAYPLLDRFFYLTGLNSLFYFDFFSTHTYYYFHGEKLDFGISDYDIGLGYLIDNQYYGGGGTNQSAGFMPSAYANLGVFGLILQSIFLGLIVAWIATLQDRAHKFTYLVCIALGFLLMNFAFFQLFLSAGLIFIILIPLIIRDEKFNKGRILG